MGYPKGKGQAAIEYIVLLGVILFFIVAVFVFASIALEDTIALNQAKASVQTLAQTIDNAYALGPGTRLYAETYFPKNIDSTILQDKEIGLRINLSSGTTAVYEYVDANITGSFSSEQGMQRILIEVLDSGVVRIGEAVVESIPPVIYLEAPANGATDTDGVVQFDYNVTDADSDVASCELIINGSVDQTDYSISEGTTQSFSKTFSTNGSYSWDINCTDSSTNANEGSSVNGPRTININIPAETVPPVIYLEAPDDNATDTDGSVTFDYNVNDVNSAIASCELIIDGNVDQTDFSITEGVTQSFSKTFSSNGAYVWDINCTDASTNANEGSSINGPRTINITGDLAPPAIYLEAPNNNATDTDGIVRFDYNVTDVNSGIANCGLILNGSVSMTDYSVTEGATQSFYKSGLGNGTYSWDVNCTDDSNNSNEGSSLNGPRTLTVSRTQASYFSFAWPPGQFTVAGKYLDDWTIQDANDAIPLQITRMKILDWYDSDLDNAVLTTIRLNATSVWSGSSRDGSWIDITDFNVPAGTTYSTGNSLRFSKRINNDREDFRIVFEFSDDSNYTTPVAGSNDFNAPIIQLEAPNNNATDTDGGVSFDFNVHDVDGNVTWCHLIIDGQLDQDMDVVTENTTQTFSRTFLLNGAYTWDVNCMDTSLNQNLGSSVNGPRTININVTDTTSPVVTLEAPAAGATDLDGNVQFDYTVYDAQSGVASCKLIIDGSVDQTDNTITEGVIQSFFKYSMADGNYYWDVNCTDDSSNALEGSSDENRHLIVNRSAPVRVSIAFDTFESGNWTGGSGWVTDWNVLGDSVVTGTGSPHAGSYHTRLRRGSGWIDRAVNVSSYSSVNLEFWWKAESFETGEQALVKVYDGSWHTVFTVNPGDADGIYHFRSIDLSSYNMISGFKVAFDAEMGVADDRFYVDDVNVTGISS